MRDVRRRHRHADVDPAHLLAVLRGGGTCGEREDGGDDAEARGRPAAQRVDHAAPSHSLQLPMVTRPPAASTAALASFMSTTCSTLGFFAASMSPTETS